MKILTVIPAYNEENTIGEVVQQIKHNFPSADILVINDGSRDDTSIRAQRAGAIVADLPFNLGIGGAMQAGFLYAKREGYDIAVQVDGDGQHDPFYISKLVEPIEKDIADVVIGSRYISKSLYKSSVLRRVGMILLSTLVSMLVRQKLKDTTSGFRAINRKVIDYFSENYPVDYPEVDVLVRLYKRNIRIIELPVEMLKRQSGISSITPLRSVYYMLKVSLSVIIGSVRTNE